ncbi:MAG: DNA pilot protein [Microviridae sp.]|nr:MAG: DNA pilot protein [Microviridae sp.]
MGETKSGLSGIAAGLPVIGGVISGMIDSANAKRNTDKTIEANRELAAYQYSKDLEMWNKGNAYNDPSAQMARLKNAGLNPNLIYGTGAAGAAGNTATSLPKYQAPTVSYNYHPQVDPLAIIGAYQNFKIQQAQVDNLKAQRDNIQSETFNRNWRYKGWAEGIGYENAMKREKLEQVKELRPYQLQSAQQHTRVQDTILSLNQKKNDMMQMDIDNYFWRFWGNMASKFGMKLPSFRK